VVAFAVLPCSVPEDGSAGGTGAGLVVPRIGGVRALRLGRRIRVRSRRLRRGGGRSRCVGYRLRIGWRRLRGGSRRLRGCSRWLRRCPFGLRRCPPGLWRSGFAFRRRGRGLGGRRPRRRAALPAGLGHRAPGVVPQGGLDDLQAPLGPSPPGELRPRQHLLHLRGVVLGELQPDGDRFRLGPPGTCHAFKVPRTSVLTEARRDCLK